MIEHNIVYIVAFNETETPFAGLGWHIQKLWLVLGTPRRRV